MNSLHRLRHLASIGTMALLWINVALLAAAVLLRAESPGLGLLAGGIVLALLVTAMWIKDRDSATYRVVNSMALAAQVATLVYAFTGSEYQIDMHMYFFATLAIAAVWVDWRAIAGYAALVAVHHLTLYFLLPAAVFPGQSDFLRVVLHAVILVAQAGTLIFLSGRIAAAFAVAEQSGDAALAASREAERQAEQVRLTSIHANAERQALEADKQRDAEMLVASVDKMAEGLAQLSAGNLAFRISTPLHERVEGLRASFNASMDELERTMGQVGHAASIVRSNTLKINSSNHDLSSRTEQQAANVEETAASLTQVTQTVQDTAKRAEEVNRMVEHTKANAVQSAEIVTSAVAAMGKIEESSSQISNIIGVIDEIAFQTNLLALNAGVEAARAGDAGKGFAVVAQEVRELAQRSANAAKEIKALISTSGEQVKQGVQLVGQTGGALNAIAAEVQSIASNINHIVQGAREQAVGLQGISGSLNGIDQNTQRNAAMVQDSATVIQTLVQGAETLEQLLARFATSGRGSGEGSRRAA